ncbi:MAG TPA: hypothetical protein VFI62_02560 [Burkholderiales bacterium]|nr:hypothetical protein [Burkholderiales bacterium]
MKHFIWILLVAAATAGAAYAQKQTVEPAIPQGLPESRIEGTSPSAPELVMNRPRGNRDSDARACLQLASNTQIHRCAEPYRSNAKRPVRTQAKLSKPAGVQSPAATASTTVPSPTTESKANKP